MRINVTNSYLNNLTKELNGFVLSRLALKPLNDSYKESLLLMKYNKRAPLIHLIEHYDRAILKCEIHEA
jgi:hypothetical protein